MYLPTTSWLTVAGLVGLSTAVCPFMDPHADPAALRARQEGGAAASPPPAGAAAGPGAVPALTDNIGFMSQFTADDTGSILSSDVGGQIEDQASLKAGERGPTLLEDFVLRQKITHFDHERVPERAVHARGAGAYGTFVSNADWSNLSAASFLSEAGKETPMFVRFSTVAGSKGSSDLARDVHGFAVRFYTDEGNFDIVGNNVPVFFIQDAIQFPDLVHSVKPSPDSEIPQAATAHDSAWDFFSSQPSALHTLMWAMSGFGIVRSYRHMDGFGVHTFRMVTADGTSRLIKWHWKTKQGKASLLWEEAQAVSGKNPDFHRADLFNAIAAGDFPEWDLAVQVIEESQAQAFGFDMLDPTKFLPEEFAPLQVLGTFRLDANPTNYFAEVEQAMFQPGHIVRGIDFSEDSLLQGRIFSYLDTQLNRHGGPNFEQLPINRPRTSVNNNNRDGAGQMFIHRNVQHYTPSAISQSQPKQASNVEGTGFITSPQRVLQGNLVRVISPTMQDHFSQPRLFINSLSQQEQQILVNSIRFEMSNVKSQTVRENMIVQLNKVSNDIAIRVASVLGVAPPQPDPTFYHDNKTQGVNIFGVPLLKISSLTVGLLATIQDPASIQQAQVLQERFAQDGVIASIVAEGFLPGVAQTYSQSDASNFDGIIVVQGAEPLFTSFQANPLFPLGRPSQILLDAFRWGKAVGSLGSGAAAFQLTGIPTTAGVFASTSDTETLVTQFEGGLSTFRFLDRFPIDANAAPGAATAIITQAPAGDDGEGGFGVQSVGGRSNSSAVLASSAVAAATSPARSIRPFGDVLASLTGLIGLVLLVF